MKHIIFAALSSFILLACSDHFKVDSELKVVSVGGSTGFSDGGFTGGFTGGDGSGGLTGGTTGSDGGTTGSGGGSTGCADARVDAFCRAGGTPPDVSNVVQDFARRYPNELQRCERHRDEFVELVIRDLRSRDERWGSNWVRGNIGDSNGDVIGYYYGPGSPQENSPYNAIADVVANCEGDNEQPVWQTYPMSYHECCNPSGSTKWTIRPLDN